jgi:photosystem II stability/assembly factor-like uncharacterized protein
MKSTLLLIGTKKGLFLLTSADRAKWEMHGPFSPGKEINHVIYDARNKRIHATANDAWFGCELVSSPDLGKTWENAKQNPSFPENSGLKLERLWHIEPGLRDEPNVLYCGVAPAALFRSEDSGQTWREVVGLTRHPTRTKWNPGAGGLCLHSIALDPAQPRRIFVGISAAGVFRSEDAGTTWKPVNRGTRAEFMPDKYPEFGQCVHKLLMADGKSSLLFQQNHCGMYRSADGGESWTEITAGLPSDFGFPLAVHPRKPETIFVLPLKGAEFRCPPENKLRVFRSRDGGNKWETLNRGLPEGESFMSVYREGMAMDQQEPAGIYFGTNTGKVFGSSDEGDSWGLVADNLPPVYSVEAAIV